MFKLDFIKMVVERRQIQVVAYANVKFVVLSQQSYYITNAISL